MLNEIEKKKQSRIRKLFSSVSEEIKDFFVLVFLVLV